MGSPSQYDQCQRLCSCTHTPHSHGLYLTMCCFDTATSRIHSVAELGIMPGCGYSLVRPSSFYQFICVRLSYHAMRWELVVQTLLYSPSYNLPSGNLVADLALGISGSSCICTYIPVALHCCCSAKLGIHLTQTHSLSKL